MADTAGSGFGTRAIHSGQRPDRDSGAIMTPIFQTSTYVQDGVAQARDGHDYGRVKNPTRTAVEQNLAALEEGAYGITFSSGLAAIEAMIKALTRGGDHVVCGDNVYGGTERMFRMVWQGFGVDFSFVDTSDVDALREAIRPETKLVHIETPTNPLMRLSDIAACAEVAHDADALLSVDNTFATPYLQQPITLGADIVMHSTTKYLGGHSDLIGGALIVRDDELAEALHWQQFATGAVPGPMDSWLLLRSTKTLHVRMRAHCENAERIAAFLSERSELSGVYYPGLQAHPQHDLACRQMSGFGGMISVETGSAQRADRFAEATRVFQLAESLGGVESLISVPARMTHASVSPERRAEMGLTDGLVRLSVGIEDVDDLVADLDRALAAM